MPEKEALKNGQWLKPMPEFLWQEWCLSTQQLDIPRWLRWGRRQPEENLPFDRTDSSVHKGSKDVQQMAVLAVVISHLWSFRPLSEYPTEIS